jgi:hypothetical protein
MGAGGNVHATLRFADGSVATISCLDMRVISVCRIGGL